MTRVAVVTGSNKGIGFGIVRALYTAHPDWTIYLTARDKTRGEEAVEKLKSEGLSPNFHLLDINDAESVTKLKDYLVEKYGGLDVLINNAGIAYKKKAKNPFSEQAEVTLRTNYFNTLRVFDILSPILKSHARVVNVASIAGLAALAKCSQKIKDKVVDLSSMDELNDLMNGFIDATKARTYLTDGWPPTAYGISKMGLIRATVLQQKRLDEDKDDNRTDVIVNSCCPGWVSTDMSSHKGPLTIDEGAANTVFLAELPPDDPNNIKGRFFSGKEVQVWP